MKFIRFFTGILIILIAVSGLIFWELEGREVMLTEPFLVAKKTIPEGVKISSSDFKVVGFNDQTKMKGALKEKDLEKIAGKIVKRSIPANGQVCMGDFIEADLSLPDGRSIYPLASEWVMLKSSSLRRGDMVRISSFPEAKPLGRYMVAFVKDEQGLEIGDGKQGEIPKEGKIQSAIDRVDSTGNIAQIEIISDIDSYKKILDEVSFAEYPALMVIQE